MDIKEAEEIISRATERNNGIRPNNVAYEVGFVDGINSPDALKRKEVLELIERLEYCVSAYVDDHAEALDMIKEAFFKFKEAAKL